MATRVPLIPSAGGRSPYTPKPGAARTTSKGITPRTATPRILPKKRPATPSTRTSSGNGGPTPVPSADNSGVKFAWPTGEEVIQAVRDDHSRQNQTDSGSRKSNGSTASRIVRDNQTPRDSIDSGGRQTPRPNTPAGRSSGGTPVGAVGVSIGGSLTIADTRRRAGSVSFAQPHQPHRPSPGTSNSRLQSKDDKTIKSSDHEPASSSAGALKNASAESRSRKGGDKPQQEKVLLRHLARGLQNGGIPTKAALERKAAAKLAREERKKRKKEQEDGVSEAEKVALPNLSAKMENTANARASNTEKSTEAEKNTPAFHAPRVQVINGQIVINQESLIVHEEHETEEPHEEVYEGNQSHITSSSFTNRAKSDKWSIDETKRFYEALRTCGTDFSMMGHFFPNRDRRQLKNKFKREERANKSLIDRALNAALPLDLSQFSEMLD